MTEKEIKSKGDYEKEVKGKGDGRMDKVGHLPISGNPRKVKKFGY